MLLHSLFAAALLGRLVTHKDTRCGDDHDCDQQRDQQKATFRGHRPLLLPNRRSLPVSGTIIAPNFVKASCRSAAISSLRACCCFSSSFRLEISWTTD